MCLSIWVSFHLPSCVGREYHELIAFPSPNEKPTIFPHSPDQHLCILCSLNVGASWVGVGSEFQGTVLNPQPRLSTKIPCQLFGLFKDRKWVGMTLSSSEFVFCGWDWRLSLSWPFFLWRPHSRAEVGVDRTGAAFLFFLVCFWSRLLLP